MHAGCGQSTSSQRSLSLLVGSNGVFIGFECISFDLFLQRFFCFFMSTTFCVPNKEKLFCKKPIDKEKNPCYNLPPPGPRGDFITLFLFVKLFFYAKAKRRRAPKCPPLWRLRLTCHRQASYAPNRKALV